MLRDNARLIAAQLIGAQLIAAQGRSVHEAREPLVRGSIP